MLTNIMVFFYIFKTSDISKFVHEVHLENIDDNMMKTYYILYVLMCSLSLGIQCHWVFGLST